VSAPQRWEADPKAGPAVTLPTPIDEHHGTTAEMSSLGVPIPEKSSHKMTERQSAVAAILVAVEGLQLALVTRSRRRHLAAFEALDAAVVALLPLLTGGVR